MLDKNVFLEGMQKLVVFYPQWGVKVEDSQVVKMWYEQFQDMSNGDFSSMVNQYIAKEKFNPTIAGLKEHYDEGREIRLPGGAFIL